MLITGAKLVTMTLPNRIIRDGALLIVGDEIAALGEASALIQHYPDAERLDARGQWLVPGNICGHTHFYGAFARGMALDGPPPADFRGILEGLWWRLDKALTAEDIRFSALVCLVDAIRSGTTTLIDHHASPGYVDGSLDVIAEAVSEAGPRACLCYEVSDRDGPEVAAAGLAENARFIRKRRSAPDPRLGATFGLHAALTLSDNTLDQAAAWGESLGVGYHLHVAEAAADPRQSLQQHGVRTVHRLARRGILGPQTLAAHAVHVNEDEIALLQASSTWVAHNPRSNMNNAVGTAPVPAMLDAGVRLGLGNDGFSNDMFQEMKAAFLAQKAASGDPRRMPAEDVVRLSHEGNVELAGLYFQKPLGQLAVGAHADLVFLDYDPPTPVTAANWPWHLMFGVTGAHVTTTVVGGRVLMHDRALTGLDAARIHARARELAATLWARM
jgi:putative selenium metabolism protein SsnA